MANQAYIDAVIDLKGIPSCHNPLSVITRNDMLEIWGELPHSHRLDTGTSLCLPGRSTVASPPDGFTVVYTSYHDAKMPVPTPPLPAGVPPFYRHHPLATSPHWF